MMQMFSGGSTGAIGSLGPKSLWSLGVVASAATVVVVATAGMLAIPAAGPYGWQPPALAGGMVVLAAALGLMPLGLMREAGSRGLLNRAMLGMLLRMFSVLAMAGAALFAVRREVWAAVLLWLAGSYLVSLAVETLILACWLRARTQSRRA